MLEVPRSRIESLLTSFPKLIPAGSQHTTIETSDVRYVYQPMDDVWVVLITNLGSNILQVSRTTSSLIFLSSVMLTILEQRRISTGHCDSVVDCAVHLRPPALSPSD